MANQISLIRKSTALHVHLIVLSTFLSHHCITLRFIEEVNKSRWTFFLYEFAYMWQNERLIKKMARKNVNWVFIKSEVLTATAVSFKLSYLEFGALTRGGKNTFGHRTRRLGSCCLKSLLNAVKFYFRCSKRRLFVKIVWANKYRKQFKFFQVPIVKGAKSNIFTCKLCSGKLFLKSTRLFVVLLKPFSQLFLLLSLSN